jgi:hypothetical protein
MSKKKEGIALPSEEPEISKTLEIPLTTGPEGPEVVEGKKLKTIPDKKDIIKTDTLLQGILNDEGTFELFDMVLAEMAEESASLKYERIKKELNDEPTDRISLRRSGILKMISDSLVQKRNLALNDFVNLRSPQWQVVFEQLMQRIKQTFMDLGYSSEQLELFFQKFNENLEGFEESTEQKLKETMSSMG